MRDENNKRRPTDLKEDERQGMKEDICREILRDLRVNISWQNCFSGGYEASGPKLQGRVGEIRGLGKYLESQGMPK